MIQFTAGDMFEIEADARVNTVNCKGVMGAGVALAFKQRYPEMFKDYAAKCRRGQIRPGKVDVWKTLAGDWVINFPTKRHWREPSRYEDIRTGLQDLRSYLELQGKITVTLPALGCGHGGLDWNRVKHMIEVELDALKEASIYVFEPADSRKVGRADQGLRLKQFGFHEAHLPEYSKDWRKRSAATVFVKGNADLLSSQWLALLPSRAPTERELDALASIACEMLRDGRRATVGLVYLSRATEPIVKTLLQYGQSVVLIIPFGALSDMGIKLLSKVSLSKDSAILSLGRPEARWSAQLLADSLSLLNAGSSRALITDPDPTWLNNNDMEAWSGLPIFYVGYDAAIPNPHGALANVHARPVWRRAFTGQPNLDALFKDSDIESEADHNGRLQLPLFGSATDPTH
jgi:O-acetyl-ADP-ribose deacetylase (regulator of RNase III)